MIHSNLSKQILASCFEVINDLGVGFLESVYQNALVLNLSEKGISVEKDYAIPVIYMNTIIGQFYADIFVEKTIIVELKAVSELTDIHKAQIINYLKATGVDVGLLINFGNPKLEYRRFENKLKQG